MFRGGKMYYVLLTDKAKDEYYVMFSRVIGINKARHMEVRILLDDVYKRTIREKGWTIIKINNDGKKEIVTIEQLEQQEHRENAQPLVPIEWLPNYDNNRRTYSAHIRYYYDETQ